MLSSGSSVSGSLASLHKLTFRLRGWREARAGVAAVEFALILPLMLVLYFGSFEVTQAVRASRKVDILSTALANLASQQLSCSSGAGVCLTEADMTGSNGIFAAAEAVMTPYKIKDAANTSLLNMTVSQVTVQPDNGSMIAKVDWTVTNSGGTARPCNGGGANGALLAGNVSTSNSGFRNYLPTSYTASVVPKYSMIVADVIYSYKPGFGWNLFKWNDATTLFQTASVGYYRNRNSNGGSAGPITASMTAGKTSC